MPYSVARGPYDSNSVWNLLDAAMEAGTPLFTVKDFSNVLRALKLGSVREENLALETLNSQLRLRVEAMEAGKREAIEHWDIERVHLRQELARAQETEEIATRDRDEA
jgi:alpha-D-ribose 1-methylphosphonate 5-triphosphate diphosphatase PhnM